jgi:hypothetical protein
VADPVSWLLIEPGWKVLAADGEEIGRVEEVAGDSSTDIFNGLAVAPGLLSRPRYVPAEQVAEIVEGAVRLTLPASAFERLGEYEEPPTSAELSSEKASVGERIAAPVSAPVEDRPHTIPLLRRIALWLGFAGRRR